MSYFNSLFIRDKTVKRDANVSMLGALKVEEITRLIGNSMGTTVLDTTSWTPTNNNNATATVSLSTLTMSTGTTANGNTSLQSTLRSKFLPMLPNIFRGLAKFTTTGTTNNLRRLGCYSSTDGFFFQLSGTTFSIGTRKNSVDTLVNSGSFNGDVTTYNLDTNFHSFEIHYILMRVDFIIDDILVHSITPTNASMTNGMNFPCRAENINSAGSITNVNFDFLGMSIMRFGKQYHSQKYLRINTNATTVIKMSSGKLTRISINTKGSNSNLLTVYDNTAGSGNIIAILDVTVQGGVYEFDCDFETGLTVVTAGGQAGDYTVIYE